MDVREPLTEINTSPDSYNVSVSNGESTFRVNVNNSILNKSGLALVTALAVAPVTVTDKMLFQPSTITIPSVYYQLERTSSENFVSVEKKINAILSFYNLGKSHLSKIMGVSRPALYAWIGGDSNPDQKNLDKINQLYTIAKNIDGSLGRSIYHGFIDRPIFGYEESLLDALSKNSKLGPDIEEQIKIAYNMSMLREQHMKEGKRAFSQINHSDIEKELNFDGNV